MRPPPYRRRAGSSDHGADERLWRIGAAAVLTGSIAGLVTTASVAASASRRGKSPVQPVNATSHWLHGPAAGEERGVDLAHTGLGFATNHCAAIFWAIPFEAWQDAHPRRAPLQMLGDAAAVAAIAGVVDYGLVPKRLTPGWEEAVPPRSVAAAFGVLALGLFAGGMINRSLRADASR